MSAQNMWDHSQYPTPSLQLEECTPYPIGIVDGYPRQQQMPPSSLNIPATQSRLGAYPSAAPFGTSSAFPRQGPMRTSSFNALDHNPNPSLSINTSHAYNHQPHQPGYQTAQFASSIDTNHTPEGSPTPNAASYLPAGPMQFSTPLPLPPRQSELQSHYFNAQYLRPQQDPTSAKRVRPSDEYDDGQGEQFDPPEQEAARPKPAGACARCKSLKVRCEFKKGGDTCRRCTSAGQECVIPGRKPRRAPPKREHLLNQIREQAKQIQELMAKVAALNQPATAQSPRSPMESNSESVVPNAEMQDWFSKACVSIQEFGGLIPAENPSDAEDLSDEYDIVEEFSDESGYATAEDDGPRDIGSPASSTTKRQGQTTSLKMLPGEDAPYGLMAALAIRKSAREKSVEPESSDALGVANADFFRPSPGPDPKRMNPSASGVQLPHILARGIVSIQEVEKLFTIYFEKMNLSANLLDPALHTPQYVAMRSPFLFTMICGVASRFYEPRPDLYQQLMHFGQLAAGTALISGTKNEEMSAAYLLMQLYPVPAKRWDEERSWIYLGVAIRVAQDINLNRSATTKPLNEQNARILLSRQRIWFNCFNLDCSTGTQYGKRPIIPDTDYFATHSEDWWKSSPYNMKGFDIHLCGYNAELRLMSSFMKEIYGNPSHPTGLNKDINIAQLASDTDDALRNLGELWFKRLDEVEEEKTDTWVFRSELLRMAYAYARLRALSTGLKHAKDGQLDENTFIMRCLDAASDIVNAFVRRLFTTPERKVLLRHAPDAQFVFVTFAGAFLVKLLQPKYGQYFTPERRVEVRTLVQEAVDLLGAPEVCVDDKHGPKLFSRFLGGLLRAQSMNPNSLSPITKSSHLRRNGSKSKGTSGKQKESNDLLFSPLNSAGSSSDHLSPSSLPFSEFSSPAQQTTPLEDGTYAPRADPSLDPNTADLYQTTMLVDQELLDSMSILADPVWQETSVPGYHWVNQLNGTNSSALQINDYALYEPQYGTSY